MSTGVCETERQTDGAEEVRKRERIHAMAHIWTS